MCVGAFNYDGHDCAIASTSTWAWLHLIMMAHTIVMGKGESVQLSMMGMVVQLYECIMYLVEFNYDGHDCAIVLGT